MDPKTKMFENFWSILYAWYERDKGEGEAWHVVISFPYCLTVLYLPNGLPLRGGREREGQSEPKKI